MGKTSVSFVPNVWIKCIHKNIVCIGRTYLQRGVKNTLQMICLMTQKGHGSHVLFSEVTGVCIIKNFSVCEFDTLYPNLQKEDLKELTKKLASLQLNTSMS